jgi:hypothetical protein
MPTGGYADAIMKQMSTVGQPNVTTTELTQPKQSLDLAQLGMLLMLMLQGMGGQGGGNLEDLTKSGTNMAGASMAEGAPGPVYPPTNMASGAASPLAAGGRFGAANINPLDLVKMLSALRGMKRTA